MARPSQKRERTKKSIKLNKLEHFDLFDEDKDEYKQLLMTDALTVIEAACLLYPTPRSKFKFCLNEDEGRMGYILEQISRGIATNKLRSVKISGNVHLTHAHVLDWAVNRKLICPPLVSIVKPILKKNRILGAFSFLARSRHAPLHE